MYVRLQMFMYFVVFGPFHFFRRDTAPQWTRLSMNTALNEHGSQWTRLPMNIYTLCLMSGYRRFVFCVFFVSPLLSKNMPQKMPQITDLFVTDLLFHTKKHFLIPQNKNTSNQHFQLKIKHIKYKHIILTINILVINIQL